MLSFIFVFISALVSVLWLGISLVYVETRIGISNLLSMNPSDLAFFITGIFVPIVVLWVVAGFIYYANAITKQGKFLEVMLYHLKKSSDQNGVITKSILESRELVRNSETLKYIDTAVADLNNTIADIAIHFGIMRKSSVEGLWHKVSEGDRWAFCNVILENSEDIKDFDFTLRRRLATDKELDKAIGIFCTRFEHLFELLSASQNNRALADIIENSSLGKLYSKLANMKKGKNASTSASGTGDDDEVISESYIRSLFTDDDLPKAEPADIPEADTTDKDEPIATLTTEEISITEIPISSPEDKPSTSAPISAKAKEKKVSLEVTDDLPEDSAATSYDWEERKKEILSRYGKHKKPEA